MKNIAIVGFGGVGKTLTKLIAEKNNSAKEPLNIVYILDLGGGVVNHEGIDVADLFRYLESGQHISTYPQGGTSELTVEDIINDEAIDALVEMTWTNKETGEPAYTTIKQALNNKKHVVTSNKGPIMLYYHELKSLAQANGVQLAIGCTTGGALPSVGAGLFDMAGSTIYEIKGVLNGTTNYILNQMVARNIEYPEALKLAQQDGIAETDPSLDVEGWDTAIKLLILTNVLYESNVKLSDIKVQGITDIKLADLLEAQKQGKKAKLVGVSRRLEDEIVLEVKPEYLEPENILYHVDGKNKAVQYQSETLGELIIIGGASGLVPAAASIYRDIINLQKGYRFVD